jgi:ADP-heptose:LPS heptosyltransferase
MRSAVGESTIPPSTTRGRDQAGPFVPGEGFRPATVTKLQFVDSWIGPVLCFFATGMERLSGRRAPGDPPRSIAFIKLSEQGATVLAAPALREAVRRVGRDQVFFIAFAGNREILDLMDILPRENVLEVETSSVTGFLRSLFQLFVAFRRIRPEAAIDLDFFTRASALLTWATGAARRVGLHAYFGEGPYRGDLMTHRCRYNPHWHTANFFLALVHALDQAPDQFPTWPAASAGASTLSWPRPDLPPAARHSAQELILRTLKLDQVPPLVLLNANCSDLVPLRKWMPDRYVELAQLLLERHPDIHLLFTGAPAEAAHAIALATQVNSPRCGCIAGQTTLTELLAVYDLASVLVTNDSGPVHFASLTRVKTVALFGPETPALFGPKGEGVALSAGLPCSPCVSAQNTRQLRRHLFGL